MTTDALDRSLESADAAPVCRCEGANAEGVAAQRHRAALRPLGNRVRYRLSDLEAWLADHTVTPAKAN